MSSGISTTQRLLIHFRHGVGDDVRRGELVGEPVQPPVNGDMDRARAASSLRDLVTSMPTTIRSRSISA